MIKPPRSLIAAVVLSCLLVGCSSGNQLPEDTLTVAPATTTPTFDATEQAVSDAIDAYLVVSDDILQNLSPTYFGDEDRLRDVATGPQIGKDKEAWKSLLNKGEYLEGNTTFTTTKVKYKATENSGATYTAYGCLDTSNARLVKADGSGSRPARDEGIARVFGSYIVLRTHQNKYYVTDNIFEGEESC
jgi:hypothetical protein